MSNRAEELAAVLENKLGGAADEDIEQAAAELRRLAAVEAERDSLARQLAEAQDDASYYANRFAEIEAQRDRLAAEVEALRPNAERYLWLRDGQVITYRVSGRAVSNPFPACSGQHLDAAIDAACKEQG